MSNHTPENVERHADVCVVGGSAAGLAAALQIARQRRSVIVVDAGEPRNAPAATMHGYLGLDGIPPADLAAAGRDEVRTYGGEILAGSVTAVRHDPDGDFRIELTGGIIVHARRVVAATGLIDELPDIDGLAEHWGGDVIHCPFCHGYEVRDRRITVILTHPTGLHPVTLFGHLTDALVVVVHDARAITPAHLQPLRAAGVKVRGGPARRVVTAADGHVFGVELADGTVIETDVIAVGPRFRARAEVFTPLGVAAEPHPSGLGTTLATDDLGRTSVPGLYAAGNVTDPMQQVLHAAAGGSRVGAMVSSDLATQDQQLGTTRYAGEVDWDQRYSGEQLWSGRPNGNLVAEVADLVPGRALDVGAGEGGDALWLAEQGWAVVASDVSSRALERIATEADRRDVIVETLHVDANAVGAYADEPDGPAPDGPAPDGPEPDGRQAFDLVTASYASIPRTPDHRAVSNILGAVALGGILVVISHDVAAMRAPIDVHVGSQAYDVDAYERVADFAAVVEASDDWIVEVDALRPRPPGAASEHHIDDIVLRARRIR
ncbi:MAG TPA: FAD-dependent oxidoreductase [Acidimicrobiales bacterium]|nr:FAD-dependent oxidoreductase [Acidimicrobiales bacterium]